jgi:hypothetical protein
MLLEIFVLCIMGFASIIFIISGHPDEQKRNIRHAILVLFATLLLIAVVISKEKC